MNSARISGIGGALAAVMCLAALSGCTSTPNGDNGSGSGATNTPVEVGNTVNYTSTGSTNVLDCADGKSLTIGGANNTLTVNGTCSTVNIGGTDNKVTLDTVTTALDVVGMNATVVYKNGSPKVNNTGSRNTIHKS